MSKTNVIDIDKKEEVKEELHLKIKIDVIGMNGTKTRYAEELRELVKHVRTKRFVNEDSICVVLSSLADIIEKQ